jgi:beta-1,4-mannosyltransferase
VLFAKGDTSVSPKSKPGIRAVVFGYFRSNPYLSLYKESLERQGINVQLEDNFGLKWMITRGRFCDVVHLHWIETAYAPSEWNTRSGLVEKLINHHLPEPLRRAFRLTSFTVALCLAKLQRKTIIYTVHNLEPHDKKLWLLILHQIAHRVVLSLADHIHAHNHYTRKVLEDVYHRKVGIIVVPHGNYVGYYPDHISKSDARKQLGLPNNVFVYLFFGLIRPYKGTEELIDAFGKLQMPASQLLIVGKVKQPSYPILDLGQNSPAIKLVPEYVPDENIQIYMKACDVCVFPYKNVTTSGAAMLALSFGRPVIAPAIASFPELVTPGIGILYDPSQPNALTLALQQARQRAWSESDILDYACQFDWDKLGSQLADLCRMERDRPQRRPELA